MKKVTNKLTAQGLTQNGNEVVQVAASYKEFKKHLIVFYNSENKVLSAQVDALWFTPEKPLCNFLKIRTASEIILDALNWAILELPAAQAAYDSADYDDYQQEYDKLCCLKDIIDFADSSNFITQCENEIEKQKLKLVEELRLAAIHAKWLQYPRIEKPKSHNLPLEVDYDLISEGLTICYQTKQGLSFIKISYETNPNNGRGYIDYKHVTTPSGKIVRGWYDQGHGYSGGHVSQSDYYTWNANPNKDASYFLDTTYSGNTSGYYPSMLSF